MELFEKKFFSVRNDESDASLIKWDSRSNIVKPEIEALIPRLLRGGIVPILAMHQNVPPMSPNAPMNQLHIFPNVSNNTSAPDIPNHWVPLLYEHREHLTNLWKDFKTGSIITNRKTLRSLTENHKKWTITLKVIENESQLFYFLNSVEDNYHIHNIDRLSPIIVQNYSNVKYTDYCYKKKTINGVDIHYTCEIDAFTNDQPIEIKAFKDKGKYNVFPKIAYVTAIQCYFADIQEILVGFHNQNLGVVKLKLFSRESLEDCAKMKGHDCKVAISQMETHLTEITNYMRNTNLLGKTLNITKNVNGPQETLSFEILQ